MASSKRLKVYLEPHTTSRGIVRVYEQLVKHKPDNIDLVKSPNLADLEIIHVIGRNDRVTRRIDDLTSNGRKYAMIQYVLRSSMKPDTRDWTDLWEDAEVVWSYYDLHMLCNEDGVVSDFNFYHAPLGVDPEVFHETKMGHGREFVILTCSQHALTESVRECILAAKELNLKVMHLGHELRRGLDVICINDVPDKTLKYMYSACKFVSGLRRDEGFEFPVIEGLMCGARPIVFDAPHYRQWFDEFAIFIPEEPREKVIRSLVDIFENEDNYKPVSEEEKELAKGRFNWQTIITNFWKQI